MIQLFCCLSLVECSNGQEYQNEEDKPYSYRSNIVYRDAMTKVPRMEDAKDTDSGKIWSKNYHLQKRDPTDDKTSVFL